MILQTRKHKVEFQIDSEDYDRVCKHVWHTSNGHICSNIGGRKVYLSQFIMENPPPKDTQWTHLNGDKLDNRKENIGLRRYIKGNVAPTFKEIKNAIFSGGPLPEGVEIEFIREE